MKENRRQVVYTLFGKRYYKMNFIKDCLSRNMSLHDIEVKYGITDVLGEYQKRKQMYSQDEINAIMEEVYYGNA